MRKNNRSRYNSRNRQREYICEDETAVYDRNAIQHSAASAAPKKNRKGAFVNISLKVLAIAASAAIITGLAVSLPIVEYRTVSGNGVTIEQISYLDSLKKAQPAILQEGELKKP